MIRDHIASRLQESKEQINELREQERIVQENKGKQDQQARNEVNKARRKGEQEREVLLGTQSPSTIAQSQIASATYLYITATKKGKEDTDDNFRGAWQDQNQGISCEQAEQLEAFFMAPKIELDMLPPYSFVLQFTFKLAQPYMSHDEQDFYIIPNPVRRDKILGLPYVAAPSWKGSLRAALWKKRYTKESPEIYRLFGNEREEEVQEKLHAGRLYFFPTFFKYKSLEIINAQKREERAGDKPILFESVPATRKDSGRDVPVQGFFTLLYVPFDRVGEDAGKTKKQVSEDLKVVAEGLQAMFRMYGFGAKTSDGFGIAGELVEGGTLKIRAEELANKEEPGSKKEEKIQAAQPAAPPLPHYLEAPDRLRPEYLTPEGTFRERSEAELKKMSSLDKKQYEKAKKWWEKEGKQRAEAVTSPESVEPVAPEPEPEQQAERIPWPEWSFNSFTKLVEELIEEVTGKLVDGGDNETKPDHS